MLSDPKQVTTRRLLQSVFSPAGVLAFYLWAGIPKSMLMDHMPIDFTALLGGILFICIGREVVFSRRHSCLPVPFCVSYGLYVGAILLSLTYTTAPIGVAKLKLSRLVIVDGVAVFATLFLITDVEKLESLILAQICIGVALSLSAIARAVPGQIILEGIGGSSYIADGRVIGLALGLSISMFDLRRTPGQAMTLILIIGLLLISARGPFIAAVISCFALMLHRMRNLRKPSVAALVGLLIAFCVFLWLDSQGYFITMQSRLARLSIGGADASYAARSYFATSATEMFLKKPVFGWGLSSFPFYAGTKLVEETPHNLVLELLCELGLVGFLPFMLLLIISVFHLRSTRTRIPKAVAEALWYAFVFWIATIPTLALASARAFFCLLATISTRTTHIPKAEANSNQ